MSAQASAPVVGKAVSMEDVELILEAISKRKKNFPDEPGALTIALVLMNIGERYSTVTCQELEWTGLKKDIPKSDEEPRCPNGHSLTQVNTVQLGWISD